MTPTEAALIPGVVPAAAVLNALASTPDDTAVDPRSALVLALQDGLALLVAESVQEPVILSLGRLGFRGGSAVVGLQRDAAQMGPPLIGSHQGFIASARPC